MRAPLLQRSAFGWPLICAGLLKVFYDLALYSRFAGRKPAETGS